MKGFRAIGRVNWGVQGLRKLTQGRVLDLPSRICADRLKIRDVEQVVPRHPEGKALFASRSYFIALSMPSSQPM